MVYTSPFYFTKGAEGKQVWGGENLGLYLEALESYLEQYPDTDGIYFDGVYGRSVKNTYICCRATRELIGDERMPVSSTARFSTAVMPLGTAMTTRGLAGMCRPCTLRMK